MLYMGFQPGALQKEPGYAKMLTPWAFDNSISVSRPVVHNPIRVGGNCNWFYYLVNHLLSYKANAILILLRVSTPN